MLRAQLPLFFFFTCFSFLLMPAAKAQLRWVGEGAGGTGTSFNQAANWSPSKVPTATDDVEIIITSGGTSIELNADAAVRNLTIRVEKNTAIVGFVTGPYKFTVNGTTSVEVARRANNSQFWLGPLTDATASTFEFKGNVSFVTSDNDATGIYLQGNPLSKMIFGGDLTLGRKVQINPAKPINVVFDGTGTQVLQFDNPDFTASFNNVTVGDANSPVVQLRGDKADEILGNLVVNNSASLQMINVLWERSLYGGSLFLNNSSSLKLQGVNFPSNFATVSLSAASTVDYNNGSGLTQYVAPLSYGNLTLSRTNGNPTRIAGGNFAVAGTFQIDRQVNFESLYFTYQLGGAFINNGSFQGASSTFVLSGSADQTISGPNISFYNLTIDKPSGKVALSGSNNISVNGRLTLTKGIIESTASSMLNLTNGSSVEGGSNASYVNGPMRKVGNTAFIFPVGKNGRRVPIGISAPASSNSGFTAEYFPANPYATNPKAAGLATISNCEYWQLNRTNGNSSVDVTLYWSADNACFGDGYITDPASIVVAHNNGTSWNSYGGTGTGTAASGSVTWSGVANFSPFTLGSTSTVNPLPVVFVDVKATAQKEGVYVSFANATEENIAVYELQRSADGGAYTTIANIAPTANNNSRADYLYIDRMPLAGDNYYRIKAVETGGKTIYSDVVKANAAAVTLLSVYPSPLRRTEQLQVKVNHLPAGRYTVQVYGSLGQLVSSQQVNHVGGYLLHPVPLQGNAPGYYTVRIAGPVQLKQSFLIQ